MSQCKFVRENRHEQLFAAVQQWLGAGILWILPVNCSLLHEHRCRHARRPEAVNTLRLGHNLPTASPFGSTLGNRVLGSLLHANNNFSQ